MNDNFCAMILTHGRPNSVHTYNTLISHGYTGKVYIVIDDEDSTADEYRKVYGDMVLQFSKEEIAKTFDEADNFKDRRAIIYARNACFKLAEQVGCEYFIQLDDDYTLFRYRSKSDLTYCDLKIKTLDNIFSAMLEFFISTPKVATIALAQSGDFIGGPSGTFSKTISLKRKAMNSFICSTARPFQFVGRINEDVNTYTYKARSGLLMLTLSMVSLTQKQTQSNKGGMTDIYLDSGTYVKSFYSVLMAPSCVKIAEMGSAHKRLHHKVSWDNAVPQIVKPREAT